MSDNLEEIVNKIFIKLNDEPPTAHEQSRMMADAFKAIVEKNPTMMVEDIDRRFVKITGDTKQLKDKTISGYLHRAGESVTFDALQGFFSDPLVKEKWGGRAVEITASMLIPANLDDESALYSHFNDIERQAFLQAKAEWTDIIEGESITDFWMRNAYPIESKAKLDHRIFIHDEGHKEIRSEGFNRVRAKNEYIKQLGKMGGKTVVGSVLFNVTFEQVASAVMEKLNKAVIQDLKKTVGKSMDSLVVSDVDFSGLEDKGRLFKIVSMQISMFVPAVVDDSNFEQWLKGQVITKADHDANRVVAEFTTEMIDRMVEAYQRKYI